MHGDETGVRTSRSCRVWLLPHFLPTWIYRMRTHHLRDGHPHMKHPTPDLRSQRHRTRHVTTPTNPPAPTLSQHKQGTQPTSTYQWYVYTSTWSPFFSFHYTTTLRTQLTTHQPGCAPLQTILVTPHSNVHTSYPCSSSLQAASHSEAEGVLVP
jgi:hypothetical protein